MNEDPITEEVLLGYLRSSRLVRLVAVQKQENETTTDYTYKFNVDNEFGATLVKALNNKFIEYFKSQINNQ